MSELGGECACSEIRMTRTSANTHVSGLHFDLKTKTYYRGPRSFSSPLRTPSLLPFLPSELLLLPHLYVLPQFALSLTNTAQPGSYLLLLQVCMLLPWSLASSRENMKCLGDHLLWSWAAFPPSESSSSTHGCTLSLLN